MPRILQAYHVRLDTQDSNPSIEKGKLTGEDAGVVDALQGRERTTSKKVSKIIPLNLGTKDKSVVTWANRCRHLPRNPLRRIHPMTESSHKPLSYWFSKIQVRTSRAKASRAPVLMSSSGGLSPVELCEQSEQRKLWKTWRSRQQIAVQQSSPSRLRVTRSAMATEVAYHFDATTARDAVAAPCCQLSVTVYMFPHSTRF